MNVGPVTLTKRGSAVDVDEQRRRWKLSGEESETVVLTRVLGKPVAIIAHPVR
jgi:THUMP domain-like